MTQKNRATEMLELLKENGYDMQDLINLLRDVEQAVRKENPPDVPEKSKTTIEWRVSNLLKGIGMPMNILGYQYMKKALILIYENEAMLHNITKELYPTIANEFGTKPSRAERALRHSIEATFDRGNLEILHQVLGFSYSRVKGKATNSEFISALVETLKQEELE